MNIILAPKATAAQASELLAQRIQRYLQSCGVGLRDRAWQTNAAAENDIMSLPPPFTSALNSGRTTQARNSSQGAAIA